jgi:hypothetical protein
MLKLIVPPPMELASVIAWRSEPVPESLVFVTVKTKGATGLGTLVDPCATAASVSLKFPACAERADCAVSCAGRPNPTSAKEMPVRTIARPKKTREPKKADCETGFFLIRRFFTSPAREVLKA